MIKVEWIGFDEAPLRQQRRFVEKPWVSWKATALVGDRWLSELTAAELREPSRDTEVSTYDEAVELTGTQGSGSGNLNPFRNAVCSVASAEAEAEAVSA